MPWGTITVDSLPAITVFNKTTSRSNKAVLVKFDGEKNIDYFLEFCLTDILDAFKKLEITEGKDKFCIIRKVLVGTARPVWDKIVHEHYNRDTQKNVSGAVLEAIGFFLESFLNCEYAQDANWKYFRNC